MREDIKDLLKTRPIWQELHPQETVGEKPVLPVQQIVQKMREEYPYFTDLITAYIIAKNEGDESTAHEVKLLLDQYKKDSRK